jgi:hypothetical protein
MLWIYDIEIYQNFFSITFKNYKTKEIKQFVIFQDKNDTEEIIKFIDNPNIWLVGYNNSHFDNQLLKFMWENRFMYWEETPSNICNHIYTFAKQVVEDDWRDHMYRLPFKSLDLMKIGNLSQKSLKLAGTVFKWHKLQDLPYSWDSIILSEQVDKLLRYNLNDVEITERLAELLEGQIRLRFDVSKEYDVNAYSESDSGIANKLLEKFYEEASGIPKQKFKKWRTKRKRIGFWEVIFDDVNFRTPELNKFLDEMRKMYWYESIPFTKKKVVFNGVKYVVGVGGLHSDDKPAMYESTDNIKVIDSDIGSYYPNMIVNNNIHPAHLGDTFIKKYKEVMLQRLDAKKKAKDKTLSQADRDKYKSEADTLKIVINSTFGKLGFENHWLYDPLAMLRVTINGQLYLMMLIEHLTMKNFEVISANTDGIITLVPKEREEEYKDICRKWQDFTKFDLEYTHYKRYARTTVNDYIAITTDGDVKTKGDFNIPNVDKLHEDIFMLRRGFDRPIIAIALNEFFINDTPIKETILNHKDIYDFCTSRKTDAKFVNEYHYIKKGKAHTDQLQQSVRYYISTDGGSLYKKERKTGKMINYCVGKRVTIFNNYFDADDYNIDYAYYIQETQKMIDQIINPQLTLF